MSPRVSHLAFLVRCITVSQLYWSSPMLHSRCCSHSSRSVHFSNFMIAAARSPILKGFRCCLRCIAVVHKSLTEETHSCKVANEPVRHSNSCFQHIGRRMLELAMPPLPWLKGARSEHLVGQLRTKRTRARTVTHVNFILQTRCTVMGVFSRCRQSSHAVLTML